MLNKELEKAINDQINWELYSGYLYLSMSAYFAELGLPGFASWMKNQSGEELFHAMKMYGYVIEKGGRVILEAIQKPESEWKSPLAAFEEALAHEEGVTARINKIMDLAMTHKDFGTVAFYQWFVTEQVEEEASVSDAVAKLKLVGDGGGLYMLDKELAARSFTWPAPATK